MASNTYNDAENNQDGGDPGNWSLGNVPIGTDVAVLDATTANDCILSVNLSCAGVDRQAGYNGVLDANTFDVTTTGNITLNGAVGSVDMGVGSTWRCGGTFDYKALTTLNRDTSTLIMTGDGTSLTGISSSSKALHNLTISPNISVSYTDTAYARGTILIQGNLDLASGKILWSYGASLTVEATGTITGTSGFLYFNNMLAGTGLISNEGSINIARVTFQYFANSAVAAAGNYASTQIYVPFQTADKALTFSAGDLQCGELYIHTASAISLGKVATTNFAAVTSVNCTSIRLHLIGVGAAEIDNSGSADWTISDKVWVTNYTGSMIWTKGSGSVTFNPSANQAVDFISAQTFEDVIFAATNDAIITFAENWTADSFVAESGHFDPNGLTMETVGAFSINEGAQAVSIMSSTTLWDGAALTIGGVFTAQGSLSDQCNMQGDGGWTLNVTTAGSADNVIVSGSNAATGVTIYAGRGSTDGGGTTNWIFWESQKPLVVGASGAVQQLQIGDGLNVGDYELPNTLGSNGKTLLAVASEAVWAYASHTDLTGVGADQHHNEAHVIASHSDTTATGAELETLTDGSDATALHVHDGSDHDIADHNDTTATGTELETLTDGSDADALHAHTYAATPSGNTTFYVATTGNDTTGTGAVGFPYLTLDRALTAVYDTEFEYHAVATIELADGYYASRELLVQSMAPSLVIQGETVHASTVSEVSAVSASGDIYSVTLTVASTAGMVVGYDLGVDTKIGKLWLNGTWEILAIGSGTSVQIKIHSHVVTPTTGLIVAATVFCATIIVPDDPLTIEIRSDSVTLTNLSFVGEWEDYGISIKGCGNVTLGPDLLVSRYQVAGVYARGAHFECVDFYISYCANGIELFGSSTVICLTSVISGHSAYGLICWASDAVCNQCMFAGNAQIGLLAARFAKVEAVNTHIYANALGAAAYYESYCEVHDGNTWASNSTNRLPNSGEGNFNSYMRS